ncbi:putative transmembrane GTPase FZO-like, chloroplastic, partial [Mucuna pruriens]
LPLYSEAKLNSACEILVTQDYRYAKQDLTVKDIVNSEKKNAMPTTTRIQNGIIGPAVSAIQKILEEYENWLYSKYTQQGRLYKESSEKRWPSLSNESSQMSSEADRLLKKVDQAGSRVIDN